MAQSTANSDWYEGSLHRTGSESHTALLRSQNTSIYVNSALTVLCLRAHLQWHPHEYTWTHTCIKNVCARAHTHTHTHTRIYTYTLVCKYMYVRMGWVIYPLHRGRNDKNTVVPPDACIRPWLKLVCYHLCSPTHSLTPSPHPLARLL